MNSAGSSIPPLFPAENCRHMQRAFRDMLADLLPLEHGFLATLRIADFEGYAVQPLLSKTPLTDYDPKELNAPTGDYAELLVQQATGGKLARNSPTVFTPYQVAVRVQGAHTHRVVLRRISFRADQLPQTDYIVHYAPGTVEDDNMQECVGPPQKPRCAGTYWLRPLSRFREEYWNTRTAPNEKYVITVTAEDIAGNRGSKTVLVDVKN